MPRLKIHIAWNGEMGERPSQYDFIDNVIFINPYFVFTNSKWFWFPLFHEVMHWMISKIPSYKPKGIESCVFWELNIQWDLFYRDIICRRILFYICNDLRLFDCQTLWWEKLKIKTNKKV